MPLPTIATPTYELELPSTGKTIKYRPFVVKEEKILILALESNDVKQMNRSVKDVIKSCILTNGIKVEELPVFDIEYLFLNIRAKSIGESIEMIVTCTDDNETRVPVKVFVDEIKVHKDPKHSKEIRLNEDYGLLMKYPSLDQFIDNNFVSGENSAESIETSFKVIASCIDSIFSKDESWTSKDFSTKELIEWVEKLDSKAYKKIEEFFRTMPKLSHTFTVTNPNTGKDTVVTLEGLSDFFD